jgi:hypothetical protein
METRSVVDAANSLEKRHCEYNGCRCVKDLIQGQYCGNCKRVNDWVISAKRQSNHVFECSPEGACCDYGIAKDCGSACARCGPVRPA